MRSLTQHGNIVNAVSTETDIPRPSEKLDIPDVPSASGAPDYADRFAPRSTIGEPPDCVTEPSREEAPWQRPAIWLGVDALIRIGHD